MQRSSVGRRTRSRSRSRSRSRATVSTNRSHSKALAVYYPSPVRQTGSRARRASQSRSRSRSGRQTTVYAATQQSRPRSSGRDSGKRQTAAAVTAKTVGNRTSTGKRRIASSLARVLPKGANASAGSEAVISCAARVPVNGTTLNKKQVDALLKIELELLQNPTRALTNRTSLNAISHLVSAQFLVTRPPSQAQLDQYYSGNEDIGQALRGLPDVGDASLDTSTAKLFYEKPEVTLKCALDWLASEVQRVEDLRSILFQRQAIGKTWFASSSSSSSLDDSGGSGGAGGVRTIQVPDLNDMIRQGTALAVQVGAPPNTVPASSSGLSTMDSQLIVRMSPATAMPQTPVSERDVSLDELVLSFYLRSPGGNVIQGISMDIPQPAKVLGVSLTRRQLITALQNVADENELQRMTLRELTDRYTDQIYGLIFTAKNELDCKSAASAAQWNASPQREILIQNARFLGIKDPEKRTFVALCGMIKTEAEQWNKRQGWLRRGVAFARRNLKPILIGLGVTVAVVGIAYGVRAYRRGQAEAEANRIAENAGKETEVKLKQDITNEGLESTLEQNKAATKLALTGYAREQANYNETTDELIAKATAKRDLLVKNENERREEALRGYRKFTGVATGTIYDNPQALGEIATSNVTLRAIDAEYQKELASINAIPINARAAARINEEQDRAFANTERVSQSALAAEERRFEISSAGVFQKLAGQAITVGIPTLGATIAYAGPKALGVALAPVTGVAQGIGSVGTGIGAAGKGVGKLLEAAGTAVAVASSTPEAVQQLEQQIESTRRPGITAGSTSRLRLQASTSKAKIPQSRTEWLHRMEKEIRKIVSVAAVHNTTPAALRKLYNTRCRSSAVRRQLLAEGTTPALFKHHVRTLVAYDEWRMAHEESARRKLPDACALAEEALILVEAELRTERRIASSHSGKSRRLLAAP